MKTSFELDVITKTLGERNVDSNNAHFLSRRDSTWVSIYHTRRAIMFLAGAKRKKKLKKAILLTKFSTSEVDELVNTYVYVKST